MIRGYVSSEDEEDYFYSDPSSKPEESVKLPVFQDQENRNELISTLEKVKKINIFLKTIEGDHCGDKIHVLRELISLGVSVNCVDETHQCTPLIKACSFGKYEVVRFLLEEGANPNLNKELFTPLMACCTETYVAEELKLNCAQYLLQYGAQINARDKYHTTALMYATGSQYKSIVDLLLAQPNIDLNLQDKEGMTALFYAVLQNNSELVKKLIGRGSDITISDRNKRKAVDIALLKDYTHLARILGYIEPKKDYDFELKKETTMSDIFDELPTSLGDGGFPSDVQSILQSFKPGQSLGNKINLPYFLNSTENDLCKMGILIEYDRQKLLKCTIHQFHLTPWKKSSMPSIISDDLNIQDVIKIMSALLKHLTIINASLTYIKGRIANGINNKKEDLQTEKDLMVTLTNMYITLENLSVKLKKILKHSYQIEISYPHDFIESPTKCAMKKGVISNRKFWYGAATVLTTLLFCHLRHSYKIFKLCS